MKKLTLISFLVAISFSAFSQCRYANQLTKNENEVLSKAEIESLRFLREEELLAGDVYKYLSELYSVPVFKNISKSEDVHTGRVKDLLDLYGIEDPAINHTAGEFKNQELQKLYITLTSQGKISLNEAIVVGLTIEEKDIYDLKKAITGEIKSENIKTVYSYLLSGSHHHLKAFNAHAEGRDIDYQPQFLTVAEFKEALNK